VSRTVRLDDARTVRWRNGRGLTRELVCEPERGDWHWRLTVATSATPAPFSAYPGIERELLLLRGESLELRFRDAGVTRLVPGERARFAGENAVVGVPTAGATEQLNLMWRRDLVTAETGVGAGPLTLAPATWVVVHALASGETTVTDDEGVQIAAGRRVFWARLSARTGG
jgi:uncharacterized protein